MKNSALRNWLVTGLGIAAALACASPLLAAKPLTVVDQGRELFERQWVAGESASAGGDGLGPMFNHVSCAACHRQGGLGGAGPVDVNALMLSVNVPKLPEATQRKEFLAALKNLHPGFLTSGGDIQQNLILHRFSTDPRYTALRQRLAGPDRPFQPSTSEREAIQSDVARRPFRTATPTATLTLAITERNTPALFGARLIDTIPDAVLHSLAAAQSKHPEVSGRVAPVEVTKVGRFGWRGQIEHLHDFVLGACANEMGLEVPGQAQPVDPLLPEYRPAGQDLTAAQCMSLTSFVASLPAPRFVRPESDEKQRLVDAGRKVFHKIGCTACHIESIGQIQGIYSDLLLHDMGPKLADPVLAQPTLVATSQNLTTQERVKAIQQQPVAKQTRQMYYGGTVVTSAMFSSGDSEFTLFRPLNSKTAVQTEFRPLETNRSQEWRTPPLWGLADSAPYMHDGRAATIAEALVLHGGEATAATSRYLALELEDRLALVEFLNCLRAP
jgi:CxxC motif-containing protein (DUF1111 family)